ncbi:hypothetical protein [Fervidibacter sacchari]
MRGAKVVRNLVASPLVGDGHLTLSKNHSLLAIRHSLAVNRFLTFPLWHCLWLCAKNELPKWQVQALNLERSTHNAQLFWNGGFAR